MSIIRQNDVSHNGFNSVPWIRLFLIAVLITDTLVPVISVIFKHKVENNKILIDIWFLVIDRICMPQTYEQADNASYSFVLDTSRFFANGTRL